MMGDQNWQIQMIWPTSIDRNPELHAAESGAYDAEQKLKLAKIRADAEAMRILSEMDCPEDIKRYGADHNIPDFAEFTWQAGFAAGWKMAYARLGITAASEPKEQNNGKK